MQPNYPQDTSPQTPPQQPLQPNDYQQQAQPAASQYFNEPQQPQQPPQQAQEYGAQQYEQPQQYGAPQSDPYSQQLQPNLYGNQQPTAAASQSVEATQTKSKKPLFIIMIAVGAMLLIGLIAGGVYAWQAGLFGGQQEEVVEQAPAPAATEPTYDTPDAIETEITETQKALDGIDDSQLADGTISDETLNQ